MDRVVEVPRESPWEVEDRCKSCNGIGYIHRSGFGDIDPCESCEETGHKGIGKLCELMLNYSHASFVEGEIHEQFPEYRNPEGHLYEETRHWPTAPFTKKRIEAKRALFEYILNELMRKK